MSSRKVSQQEIAWRRLVGNRIANRRVALGLSQAEVGRAIGVGYTAVLRWENGTHTPNLWHAMRLARTLKFPLRHLVEDPS